MWMAGSLDGGVAEEEDARDLFFLRSDSEFSV
jgi:hypothetical protein